MRCFLGEEIDRVPFGVGIGWWPWGDAFENWKRDSGDANLDLSRHFGFDGSFISPAIASGIFPAFERQVLAETDEFITWRDEKGITKRDRRDGASMPEFLGNPVVSDDDWERLKAERLRIDDPERLTQDWDAFRAQQRETGAAVQVGGFPFGVFGTPRDLLGDEELLVSFYTRPALVHDMMDHLTSLWLAQWERVADEVQIDHIHIWEDMSGRQGSLISPQMAADFMMPCYDRIADFARAHGVRLVSVDTDGDCSELVPLMMEHGVNMFLPLRSAGGQRHPGLSPPLSPSWASGAAWISARWPSPKPAVDEEVDRAEAMIRLGRYAPGFDHLIPPDAKWELYAHAAERIKTLCYQPI